MVGTLIAAGGLAAVRYFWIRRLSPRCFGNSTFDQMSRGGVACIGASFVVDLGNNSSAYLWYLAIYGI